MTQRRKPKPKVKPPKEPGRPGRPRHAPDDKTRRYIEAMAASGEQQDNIAKVIGIDAKTLRKYYGPELDTALIKANAQVAQALFKNATGDGDWQKANMTAAVWWEKTRAGKREPRQDVNHTGAVGSYDLSKVSDEDLARLETILAGAANAVGGQGGD